MLTGVRHFVKCPAYLQKVQNYPATHVLEVLLTMAIVYNCSLILTGRYVRALFIYSLHVVSSNEALTPLGWLCAGIRGGWGGWSGGGEPAISPARRATSPGNFPKSQASRWVSRGGISRSGAKCPGSWPGISPGAGNSLGRCAQFSKFGPFRAFSLAVPGILGGFYSYSSRH